METNNNKKKEYDFTSLTQYFNEWQSPKQLADDIARVLFNYSTLADGNNMDDFKHDVGTLQFVWQELNSIKVK
jgi:hypothetical protein